MNRSTHGAGKAGKAGLRYSLPSLCGCVISAIPCGKCGGATVAPTAAKGPALVLNKQDHVAFGSQSWKGLVVQVQRQHFCSDVKREVCLVQPVFGAANLHTDLLFCLLVALHRKVAISGDLESRLYKPWQCNRS